ncbi:nucleoside triphosphate pyrophosphohydrolase [Sneathiella glossodoripedis]|uniref:nucleoside triphosphate pyrophosphohydrolase n=1 Tax=Sneathiella glossodoripedis TaxID=418853 RepID=UPI0004707EFD|nr:nucleoside triphosphate pyrophosphohydrolase [Sneathiella glossodoripedis]
MPNTNKGHSITALLEIMEKLRDPNGGCPWDLEQTFSTIAPHTIEEAYEVAEAIADNDMQELKSELGDLMFQVVFYAQMAKEAGDFTFDDVVQGITEKMINRHPHVFGQKDIQTAEAQTLAWEETKAAERAAKNNGAEISVLDGVAKTLPAMTRALKLQNRAARVGFDWPSIEPVQEKIIEELQELQSEIKSDAPTDRLEDEFGDLLFAVVNLGRHLKLDPEKALSRTNRKFVSRFQSVEQEIKNQGKKIEESTLEEMDRLWNEAKGLEKEYS